MLRLRWGRWSDHTISGLKIITNGRTYSDGLCQRLSKWRRVLSRAGGRPSCAGASECPSTDYLPFTCHASCNTNQPFLHNTRPKCSRRECRCVDWIKCRKLQVVSSSGVKLNSAASMSSPSTVRYTAFITDSIRSSTYHSTWCRAGQMMTMTQQ